MAQLMPLPLAASCFSKIKIGFTFLVLAQPDRPSPGQSPEGRKTDMFVSQKHEQETTFLLTFLRPVELAMHSLTVLDKNVLSDQCDNSVSINTLNTCTQLVYCHYTS